MRCFGVWLAREVAVMKWLAKGSWRERGERGLLLGCITVVVIVSGAARVNSSGESLRRGQTDHMPVSDFRIKQNTDRTKTLPFEVHDVQFMKGKQVVVEGFLWQEPKTDDWYVAMDGAIMYLHFSADGPAPGLFGKLVQAMGEIQEHRIPRREPPGQGGGVRWYALKDPSVIPIDRVNLPRIWIPAQAERGKRAVPGFIPRPAGTMRRGQ